MMGLLLTFGFLWSGEPVKFPEFMASLKQIAADLGVSYTLVSKVLNGRMGTTGASASTREAILKKAEELDYRPNRLAVALKQGKQGAFGVFIHAMGVPGSELTEAFLQGVAGEMEKTGARLWLRFFITDKDFLAACDDQLKNEVDGLIVAGVDHPGLLEKLKQIDRSGLPVVSSFCSLPKPLPANVAVDYEAQCYLTTKHLLDQGCRRIAHFHTVDTRHQGFLRAHREAGVPVQSRLIVRQKTASSFHIEDGEKGARTLLGRKVPFDGLVAQSDAQAVGAVRVLVENGLRVPGDVRVTGVDNSPLVDACQVPLTSTTAEMRECGCIAVEMLRKKANGQVVKSAVVQPRLVIRASSK
ncbi:MAG: LacI family DNA-binding transcriptional regulator [Chthoniobacteraceae bacterium]